MDHSLGFHIRGRGAGSHFQRIWNLMLFSLGAEKIYRNLNVNVFQGKAFAAAGSFATRPLPRPVGWDPIL